MTNIELSRYAAVAFQSPTFRSLSALDRSVIADQVDVAESESKLPPDVWALLQAGYSEMRPVISAPTV